MTEVAIIYKPIGRPYNRQRSVNLNGLKNDLLINHSRFLPGNGRDKFAYLFISYYRLTRLIRSNGVQGAVRTKHSGHGCQIGIAHAVENSDTN